MSKRDKQVFCGFCNAPIGEHQMAEVEMSSGKIKVHKSCKKIYG